MSNPATASSNTQASAWSPLRIPVFRALWIATVVSNIGTWMHDVGAGWMMTTLTDSPVMVAMVQTATTLPIFLLAMSAGALSDILDRRRYILVMQVWMTAVAALLAVLTFGGLSSAWVLLLLTFALGVGQAMMLPAWAAITPELVPRSELKQAIALNSMGINVARAIGPALAGGIIAVSGSGAVFALNALSFCGVMVVLYRWQRTPVVSELPAERFFGALRAGMRYARHSSALHAALIRGGGFFLFASAAWALLPLVAKGMVNGGPQAYGLLLASLGGGAVGGALLLPRIQSRYSSDVLVAATTLLYAATMLVLAIEHRLLPLCLAMAAAGVAWISVLSSLRVAAQLSLPDWVRARGLSVFMTVFMGSMALGSLLWGKVAALSDISVALLVASAGSVVSVIVTWRWKLADIEGLDLTPSMHWPAPLVHEGVEVDQGPVLITIEYQVRQGCRAEFLKALSRLAPSRLRDGGYGWGVYEDTEKANCFIESFHADSWLEHLRQHERVTADDRQLQQKVESQLQEGSQPLVRHFVAP